MMFSFEGLASLKSLEMRSLSSSLSLSSSSSWWKVVMRDLVMRDTHSLGGGVG